MAAAGGNEVWYHAAAAHVDNTYGSHMIRNLRARPADTAGLELCSIYSTKNPNLYPKYTVKYH